ncbi:3-ketoacyl-ACP reductase [Erwinia pyrifoliae]|uniref:3-ketoacyl-ACP reductase n=3 Tax=Erwinia pyrifoliae TaxID=79967 RepID=A0ABY5X6V2_ERWPY|nr:3-ketoacyl-ACP reductase [Erwinia pyrifoliae]UWS29881.1 3-ketoacyl-ACP reductase [Erwinia pyrifoliae]UWS33097.1 3-ketoacyl-ACP reductase [Erwinia pyrifoliae]UXK12892.1 3-ketoacyl-ACP reductase [Erwinia pyrifoliae]
MAPPEEMAIASAFLPGSDAGAITGSDLLVDGGVIAAIRASVKLHQRGEAPA